MRARKTIEAGQVWVTRAKKTRTPSRRVIGVAGGRICYSTGGERSRWCGVAAFRAWAKPYKAKATRTRRARSLQLRDRGTR
jgi:hypothetical protein